MGHKIIRVHIDEHRDNIETLWKEGLLKYYPERFSWLYEGNPAGPPTTYLAQEDGSKTIVGCGSLYPRRINLNGRTIVAGVAIDFMVTAEQRVFGPALKIQRTMLDNCKSDGYGIIFGFPNQSSQGIFARLGYYKLGAPSRYVRLLRSEVKLKTIVRSPCMAKLLGFAIDKFWTIIDAMNSVHKSQGFVFRVVDSCDEKFDLLWAKARKSYLITGERTTEYLNWRYSKSAGDRYKFFCIFDRAGDELLGYLVCVVRDGVATMLDLFFLQAKRVLSSLVSMFVAEMRRQGAHTISFSYLGPGRLGRDLTRLGFIQRKDKYRPVVLRPDPEYGEKLLEDSNNWYLVDGEMDL